MPFPPDILVVPQPWLSRPRQEVVDSYGISLQPRIIEVHATRSGVRWTGWPAQSFEFGATCNWVQSPKNRETNAWGQEWGGCAHAVISEQGQLAAFWDKLTRYTTYAAGFGDSGTWCCDWVAIAYELCQPLGDMPFTDACLERAAIEMAKDCVTFGIEPVRIDYLSQADWADMTRVSGLVGHEDTANGHKVGKTDPGALFPWSDFISEVRRHMGGVEDDMANDWRARRWPSGLLREAAGDLNAAAGLVDHAWSQPEYDAIKERIQSADKTLQQAREILRDNGLGPETADTKIDTFT